MEWIEFGVENVARLCGIRMKNYGTGAAEIKAQCPFCGDKHYHLYLNTEKNMWCCFRCGAGGNDVSLYSRLNGITNREAAAELLRYFGNTSAPIRERSFAETPIKPLIDRHNVYYDFLSLLRLNGKHRIDLVRRGLSFSDINQFMYRSFPTTEYEQRCVINELTKKHDLRGVPGFYCDSSGTWRMYSPNCGGFFIPVCDKDGYIQGMQLRLDSDNKRYRWFSINGYPMGTSVSSWVHVVGDTNMAEAFLTEGALKCDIASVLSGGGLFLAVPGVNALGCLGETLDSLNIRKVYEAFDMDKKVNPYVQKALEKIKEILHSRGIQVQTCSWNPLYKGIDDYCLFKRNYYNEQEQAA